MCLGELFTSYDQFFCIRVLKRFLTMSFKDKQKYQKKDGGISFGEPFRDSLTHCKVFISNNYLSLKYLGLSKN